MARVSVLIVDDEKNIRHTLRVCLQAMDASVTEAASTAAALDAMTRESFDVVFLDLRLGTERGLDLIPRLIAENPNIVVIVVTAYATVETAVEAIRRGAWDYLPKPFTPAQIRHLLEKVEAQRSVSARMVDLADRLQSEAPEVDLSSKSAAMRAVLEVVNRAAQADVSVLFRGQSGTGKGVLARTMHLESKRRDRPFVTVNCPTLTEDLLASELFGHAKGAFTGAVRDQPGRVEVAEGGTLFLDEIGEMPASLQAKLLRFLQEKVFERVGRRVRARPTCGWWRPRTATWRQTSRAGGFARIFSFA
jgi:NtrC-family two-component system response regulator AlgB